LEISSATYHRWKEQYGGADVSTVKELKAVKEGKRHAEHRWSGGSIDVIA
jgi:hypothetical protein